MVVADIDDSFAPNRGKYYPKDNENGVLVDTVLWEIRRERIVELMGEGFGFYDIRRWRMAPWCLNRGTVRTRVKKEVANAAGLTLYNPASGESDGVNGSLAVGNIFLFPKPKGWLEKYYLYQVPTTEIVLNDKLELNPGW